MKTCEEFREQIAIDAVDAQTTAHLKTCAACAEWEGDIHLARPLVRSLDGIPLRQGLAEEIRRRAVQAPAGPRLVRWLPALAAVILFGLALGFIWQNLQTPIAPDKPVARLDPEQARVRLGEHLQASKLFFRQVEKMPGTHPAEEMALINSELEATGLDARTSELLNVSTDPQVHDFLTSVNGAIVEIKSGQVERIRARLQDADLFQKIARIEKATGIQGRPIVVDLSRKHASNPELDKFLQGRASLYKGDYAAAAKAFKSLGNSPYGDDARYWGGFAFGRQGDDEEALRSLMGISKGPWLDQETLAQLKELTVRLNAKVGERTASEAKPEDIKKIIQGPAYVIVLKSSRSRPVIAVGRPLNVNDKSLALLKGMPGFETRQQGNTTWIEIQLDQLPMEPAEREVLLQALQKSLTGSRD